MKRVKCHLCKDERSVKDNIKFAYCKCCLEVMEEIKNDRVHHKRNKK